MTETEQELQDKALQEIKEIEETEMAFTLSVGGVVAIISAIQIASMHPEAGKSNPVQAATALAKILQDKVSSIEGTSHVIELIDQGWDMSDDEEV